MTPSSNQPEFDDELLSAYVDGELTESERAQVEKRLASDPAASQLVAELQSLSATLRSLPRIQADAEVRAAVMKKIDERAHSLPADTLSPSRRFLWPLLAIATLLMLMFLQPAEQEVALNSPKKSVPQIDAPAAPASAGLSSEPEKSTALTDAVAEAQEHAPPADEQESNFALVHVTLTDLRSGAAQFDQLLVSNGVQIVDDESTPTLPVAKPTGVASESSSRAQNIEALEGGVHLEAKSELSQSADSALEPEMVLVEASPAQIEQILAACQNDTQTVESLTVDEPPSPNNNRRGAGQIEQYRSYEKNIQQRKRRSLAELTPAQQGVIAALNSLDLKISPAQAGSAVQSADQLEASPPQQAWATRLRSLGSVEANQQLGFQLEQRRSLANQAFDQSKPKDKLSKTDAAANEQARVLFLLCPSEKK